MTDLRRHDLHIYIWASVCSMSERLNIRRSHHPRLHLWQCIAKLSLYKQIIDRSGPNSTTSPMRPVCVFLKLNKFRQSQHVIWYWLWLALIEQADSNLPLAKYTSSTVGQSGVFCHTQWRAFKAHIMCILYVLQCTQKNQVIYIMRDFLSGDMTLQFKPLCIGNKLQSQYLST